MFTHRHHRTPPCGVLTLHTRPSLARLHTTEVRLQACHLPIAKRVERVHGDKSLKKRRMGKRVLTRLNIPTHRSGLGSWDCDVKISGDAANLRGGYLFESRSWIVARRYCFGAYLLLRSGYPALARKRKRRVVPGRRRPPRMEGVVELSMLGTGRLQVAPNSATRGETPPSNTSSRNSQERQLYKAILKTEWSC